MIDTTKAIEIKKNLWWVGWPDYKAGFSNNPYLLIEDDVVVLFDPGSALEEHWNIVKRKIESVIPLKKITTIIVHHQDPDLCASIPLIEQELGINNFEIITTERTAIFIPYYNVKTEITAVADGDIVEIGKEHQLQFITSPYLHFAGAFNTYDLKDKLLFSSDIFGAFSVDWHLYANEHYLNAMKVFGEPYFASKKAILNYTAKIRKLDINMILPQHGSIIKENIQDYIKVLEEMEVGIWT